MVASEEKIIAQNEPKNHQYSSAHFPLCSIDGCWIFRAFPRMLAIAPPAVFSRVFVGQYPKILAHMAIGQNYHWAHHFLGKHAFYVASLMILIWENETFRLGSSRCWNNGSNTLYAPVWSYLFSKHSFFKLYQWFFTMENCRVFRLSSSLICSGGPRALLSLTRAKREKWSWESL